MLLDEIATHLASTGVALVKTPGSTSTLAYTVFKSLLPPEPDKVVAVLEVPGFAPEPGFNITRPGFQIRVRGSSIYESTGAYKDARLKAEAIDAALHGKAPGSLSGVHFAGIWARQEPFSLGLDNDNRPEFVQNYRALRVST